MANKLPFHMIGDDAFPLSMQLIKPYPQRNLDRTKRIFNYRISRARCTVENAFGILANRFRVFLSTIQLEPEKVVWLILAACTLHNLLIEKNKNSYLSVLDVEDTEELTILPGAWRNDQRLSRMQPNFGRNPTQIAKMQRDQLAAHFMSDAGSVLWQDRMISASSV